MISLEESINDKKRLMHSIFKDINKISVWLQIIDHSP
jgi:hypothetical protein